jgi:hypothetical protein
MSAWAVTGSRHHHKWATKVGKQPFLPKEARMISPRLRQIVAIPEEYARRDRSTGCLLEDLGFPEARLFLKTEDVEQILNDEPRLAALWIRRGKDQRYAGGWGIECLSGNYRVVSYGDGRKGAWQSDPAKAVAEFIVRYLCFIGDVQMRAARRRAAHAEAVHRSLAR